MKIKVILPLLEARKNPLYNLKKGAYRELLKYADNPNIFISFTLLEKAGINPLSIYDTPLGVYCYPLKNGLEFYGVHKTKNMESFPFAAKQPYIQVLEWNGKEKFIHDIDKDYTDDDLNKDIEKIKQLFPNKVFNPSITSLDDLTVDIKIAINQAYSNNPGSQFFSICQKLTMVNTKRVEHQITTTKGKKSTREFEVSQSGRNWNTLLRLLGYTGIQDNGDGIIHGNERMQAFFLSSNAYTHVDTIKNIKLPLSQEDFDVKMYNYIENNSVMHIIELINKSNRRTGLIKKYPELLTINPFRDKPSKHSRMEDMHPEKIEMFCKLVGVTLDKFKPFYTTLSDDVYAVSHFYGTPLVEPNQHNADALYKALKSANTQAGYTDEDTINRVLNNIIYKDSRWKPLFKKYLQSLS